MLIGSLPPSRIAPAFDEGAALALLAEAGILELAQHDVGEAVVDFGNIDVVRRVTPAMANARGAALARPSVVMSGRCVIALGESG